MKHDSLWTWHYWETPTWAVRWHGRAKWTNTVCVCVSHVCVYVSERVWICASLSKSMVLHVTVPVSISRNASTVKARVSLSYGQLRPLWLSRQQIAMRRDAGWGESTGGGGGLRGRTQWYTTVIPVWEKHKGQHKNFPRVSGTPRYEWMLNQILTMKYEINKTFSVSLLLNGEVCWFSTPKSVYTLRQYYGICEKKKKNLLWLQRGKSAKMPQIT